MSVSKTPATLPFDDIVAGATVRFTTIDGVQYLSIRDMIMCVCDKDNKRAAETWDRITETCKDELSKYLAFYQFPGRGQSESAIITLPGSIKLVMMLPGKRAQLYKNIFADIISRYLDGDLTMCDEISKNKTMGKKRSYAEFVQETEQDIHHKMDENDETSQVQYIYATKSAAFPGLIKIGRTGNMKARLSQLNTGCAPAPHAVITMAPTLDMFRDEYLAHQFFKESRQEGEFFAVSEHEVRGYFRNITNRFQMELVKSNIEQND